MTVSLRTLIISLFAFLFAVVLTVPLLARAAEPPTIHVKLWNKPGGAMIVTLSSHRVRAGHVEFAVHNASRSFTHEFLITRWRKSIKSLPYDTKDSQVEENRLKMLEGVEDMPPSTRTTVMLDLTPGKYVVFCNEPGHYRAGMETRFTVTR